MPLLPVYEWTGLDDTLSRRQQWVLNALGLLVGLGIAHLVGWINLTAVSLSVLRALPGGQLALVGALTVIAVYVLLTVLLDRELSETAWIVAGTVAGFYLIDLLYVHPSVFQNVPSWFYWVVKPFWVGVPMFIIAWWLVNHTTVRRPVAFAIAGLAGIVDLQLYYSVVPIPIVNGPSIQIDLIGNLTTGLQVHGLALLVALAVIVVVIEGRQYVGEAE